MGQFGPLCPPAVASFHLKIKLGDSIAQFLALLGERGFVDLVQQTQVQQSILLIAKRRQLTVELRQLVLGAFLLVLRAGSQHGAKPVANIVIGYSQAPKQSKDLLIQFGLSQTSTGMAILIVFGAAVVHVFFETALRFLRLHFARDGISTVSACNQFAGVHEVVRRIVTFAQQYLHPIECTAIDKRLMHAGIPLVVKLDFADVAAVPQDCVQLATRKPERAVTKSDAVFCQMRTERVDGVRLVGVEVENLGNLVAMGGVHDDHAATIAAHGGIAVGRLAGKQTGLHASR